MIALPRQLMLWGIDSGIRHSVGGGSGRNRCRAWRSNITCRDRKDRRELCEGTGHQPYIFHESSSGSESFDHRRVSASRQ
jgi:hypothetical protein